MNKTLNAKRAGGRPRLDGPGEGEAALLSVRLRKIQFETAQILGNGNPRIGIRTALDRARPFALRMQSKLHQKMTELARNAEGDMDSVIEKANPPEGEVKGGL